MTPTMNNLPNRKTSQGNFTRSAISPNLFDRPLYATYPRSNAVIWDSHRFRSSEECRRAPRAVGIGNCPR